jgi:predicted nucleotidyltransferase
LFPAARQRVLALLFGQPGRSFYANELIDLARIGVGAVQRELARLERSGLVTVRRVGSQKHFQANPDSPIYGELVALVRKTVGLAEPLRAALAPLTDRIAAAFVYGSVAKQADDARSDIDVIIVSEQVTYPELFQVLQPLEFQLGRPVNPTVFTRAELAARRQEGSAFVTRVLAQDKLWLIGGENDLVA